MLLFRTFARTSFALTSFSALVALNRCGEAEAALREGLRLDPSDSYGHRILGFALGKQGYYREAEASLRTALRLDPSDPDTQRLLRVAQKKR